MSVTQSRMPGSGEYGTYYERYVSLVPGEDIISTLGAQLSATLTLWRGVTERQAEKRYAPGKWSLKEVAGHILDFERIFGYRALLIARGDRTPLHGCDEEAMMRGAVFGGYSMTDLAVEFEQVRRSHISFFCHLAGEAWDRRGTVSGEEVSVRALAYIIAGHELHHTRVIRERYL